MWGGRVDAEAAEMGPTAIRLTACRGRCTEPAHEQRAPLRENFLIVASQVQLLPERIVFGLSAPDLAIIYRTLPPRSNEAETAMTAAGSGYYP